MGRWVFLPGGRGKASVGGLRERRVATPARLAAARAAAAAALGGRTGRCAAPQGPLPAQTARRRARREAARQPRAVPGREPGPAARKTASAPPKRRARGLGAAPKEPRRGLGRASGGTLQAPSRPVAGRAGRPAAGAGRRRWLVEREVGSGLAAAGSGPGGSCGGPGGTSPDTFKISPAALNRGAPGQVGAS